MATGEPGALIGHAVVLRREVSGNWSFYFTGFLRGNFGSMQLQT